MTNGTALDIFADFSVAIGSITVAAPNYIGVYLYPSTKMVRPMVMDGLVLPLPVLPVRLIGLAIS